MSYERAIELDGGKIKMKLRGNSFHIDGAVGVTALELMNLNVVELLFKRICELEDANDKSIGHVLPADAQVEFDGEDGRSVVLEDGKYELGIDQDGRFSALRYGEPWRDLLGDKMVLSLFHRVCDHEDSDADHRRLVKHLDNLINSGNGAEQASLCDVVSQVEGIVNNNDKLYSEGICADGAAILCNGRMLTITEILALLNGAANLGKIK